MELLHPLLEWYKIHQRELPWRGPRDPYRIWVSEVILQQTRVVQGLEYYHRFIRKFPSLKKFAEATEEEVLRLWQGLGYYTRSRNMHAAAREIMARHNGTFPCSYEEILALKGIGPYTAAAIASIAFGLPFPVVDGNVLRFFARYFGVKEPVDSAKGKNRIGEIAAGMIKRDDPGTFNQAVMEFGALQCRPGIPDCRICPLRAGCHAFIHNKVDTLPVKTKSPALRTRYFHYLVILKEGKGKSRSVYLKKRTSKDIWQHLYDFPLIETDKPLSPDALRKTGRWKEWFSGKNASHSQFYDFTILPLYDFSHVTGPVKHNLSHQIILATFYVIKPPSGRKFPWTEVPLDEIKKYPLPRLIGEFLKEPG